MPNIIDLIAQDSKASDITQDIKDTLYTKAAEKIETLRKEVSDSMFETEPYNPKGGMETETEVETEPTEEPEE
jgi:hypothetical protein|tara:strand:+ start:529 stop:747 length:219 start_codon:yes stop_codon:yes gene_type:complete